MVYQNAETERFYNTLGKGTFLVHPTWMGASANTIGREAGQGRAISVAALATLQIGRGACSVGS